MVWLVMDYAGKITVKCSSSHLGTTAPMSARHCRVGLPNYGRGQMDYNKGCCRDEIKEFHVHIVNLHGKAGCRYSMSNIGL